MRINIAADCLLALIREVGGQDKSLLYEWSVIKSGMTGALPNCICPGDVSAPERLLLNNGSRVDRKMVSLTAFFI
jgi:hypothetical protein